MLLQSECYGVIAARLTYIEYMNGSLQPGISNDQMKDAEPVIGA